MAVPQGQGTWDYIVVGSGSAGGVLAYRLSANPRAKVLVLEAGGSDLNPFILVPSGIQQLSTRYDWRYEALPDVSRNGVVDHWAAGKVLGGSSSINGMLWVRGHSTDYDQWAAAGCAGWAYDDVLPYFQRAETFEPAKRTPPRYPLRGRSGPLHVSRSGVSHQVIDRFLDAAHQRGHAMNPDYNGPDQEGVSVAQVSQRRGWRSSVARTYLSRARRRPNVTLVTGAVARRVLFDGRRAIGVEYERGRELRRALCSREVILAAGTLASPKLLMLSGIGPADELRAHGIEVLVNSPGVGQNLHDHAYVAMLYAVNVPTLNRDLTIAKVIKHGLNYALRGKGAISSTFAHALLFGRLPGSTRPDYEITYSALGVQGKAGQRGVSDDQYLHDVHEMRLMNTSAVTIMPSIVHPVARGSVGLRSHDPDDGPLIRYSLLGKEEDEIALRRACMVVRDVMSAPAIAPLVVDETLPGQSVRTDDQWGSFLHKYSFRGEHPVGTCRMGIDDGAVVDPQLRVRGVTNLRVVDASVMPTIVSGNTNAAAIMIGERASDLIEAEPEPPEPGT